MRRGLSDSRAHRCTASRSSISTTPHEQKPQAVLDAMDDYYRHANANIHRGVAPAERTGDRRSTRARARRRRRSSTRRIREDRSSRRTRPTASTSWRSVRPVACCGRATRCSSPAMEHHSNIVPWQLVCEADRRAAARRADRRRAASSMLDEFERAAVAADADRGHGAHVECARDDQSGRARSSRMAHAHGAVRCWSTASRRRTTCPSTCRRSTATSTSHRPQDVRPDRHRRALRKASLLEAMPPFQGGGDMIASVTFEKTTLQRRALQVRGGHAEYRRGDRASAPRSTT